jgi:hypothetical protein
MTRVVFRRVVQDSPEFGSTETKAVSKVLFDIEVKGKTYHDLHVDIEEPVGGTHSDEEMSVGKPIGVPTSVDREAFEGAVRGYYRSLVTSAGFGKHLAKDKGFRTFENKLDLTKVVEL